MLDKNILILILSLILVVAINGVPIENSEANDAPKTEDTGPQKSNKADTGSKGDDIGKTKAEPSTPVPASSPSSPSTPASKTNNTAPTEPKKDKDTEPRPILVLYSPRTTTTTTTTTTSTPTPASSPTTPRPILVLYSPNTTTTSAATPSTTDASTSTTPRPIFVFYSPNTTTSTTSTTASTITNTTPVSTTAVTSPSTDGTVKRLENILRGYKCPQRNGFFRYPNSCDVYIVCEDYIPLTYICPDGLQFNPEAKEHDYVCDDPSVVKCKKGVTPAKEKEQTSTVRPILILSQFRTTAQPALLNVMQGYSCPRRQGFFRYPGSCDSYIMCEVDTPYRYTCPSGLHFKSDALWTEYPCVEPSTARCGSDSWGY